MDLSRTEGLDLLLSADQDNRSPYFHRVWRGIVEGAIRVESQGLGDVIPGTAQAVGQDFCFLAIHGQVKMRFPQLGGQKDLEPLGFCGQSQPVQVF